MDYCPRCLKKLIDCDCGERRPEYAVNCETPTPVMVIPFNGKNDYFADNGESIEEFIADNVNHPPHYKQGKIECIDAIEAATIGLKGFEAYCIGNSIKYLWRQSYKNGLEDIKKSRWYLNRLIEHIENKAERERTESTD